MFDKKIIIIMSPSNDSANDPNFEAVVEVLGFVPISFVDEVINSVNDVIYRAIDTLESYVAEHLDPDEAEQVKINTK